MLGHALAEDLAFGRRVIWPSRGYVGKAHVQLAACSSIVRLAGAGYQWCCGPVEAATVSCSKASGRYYRAVRWAGIRP